MEFKQFENVKKYSESSGAMTTVDSNIRITMNKFGLYEETLIDPNIEVSEIAKFVSPNFNAEVNESDIANSIYQRQENMQYDKRIGYYKSLYVGYVQEGEYRKNASSGGMGTWIFQELFDNDLIDYVIHVKKNTNSEDGIMFRYDISSSPEEISAGAKTKYYPVEISEVMNKVKEIPGRYAIIGIPSFIYSIRLLAKQDEVINSRILYTIGLVCGHQKSTKFTDFLAFQVGIKPGDLIDINFRYKLDNQLASNYGVKMVGNIEGKEKTIIKPISELYGQNWGWGFFKPIASDYTDDVFNETADIVIGDAWLPNYIQDSKGNNIVIVRNTEIARLINNAIKEKRLALEEVNSDTIFESQASHYKHTHDELAYRLSVKDNNNEWYPKKRVEPSSKISYSRGKIQDLRKKISERSHILYEEAIERNDFEYFKQQMSELTSEYTKIYRKINRKKRLKRVLKMSVREIIGKVVNQVTKKNQKFQ